MKRNWVIYVLIVFCSCQSLDKSESNEISQKNNLRPTIEIEETDSLDYANFYNLRKMHLDKELNLDILNNGANNFELRLWITLGSTNGGKVMIIKEIDSK